MPKYYDFMNTYNAHLWLLTVPRVGIDALLFPKEYR